MKYRKMRYLTSALATLGVALVATAVWAQPGDPCISVMCAVGYSCENGTCVSNSTPAAAVPEPTSALLFAAGIAVVAISTARMRRK